MGDGLAVGVGETGFAVSIFLAVTGACVFSTLMGATGSAVRADWELLSVPVTTLVASLFSAGACGVVGSAGVGAPG